MRWIYAGGIWLREWKKEVLDKYKVEESKKGAYKGGGQAIGLEKSAKKQEIQKKKVVRRLLGGTFSFF